MYAHGEELGSTHRRLQKRRSGCWSPVRQRPLALIILKRSRPSYISLVFDRDTGKPKGYGFCEFAGQFYPKYARAHTNLPCR